jgi:aromatic ring-opening dioxygenase catalytic subunit (LigB family)
MTRMRSTSSGHAPDAGSQRFDDWLETILTKATPEVRIAELAKWDRAPAARDAHPREEHLLPLHVVVGAAANDVVDGARSRQRVAVG